MTFCYSMLKFENEIGNNYNNNHIAKVTENSVTLDMNEEFSKYDLMNKTET